MGKTTSVQACAAHLSTASSAASGVSTAPGGWVRCGGCGRCSPRPRLKLRCERGCPSCFRRWTPRPPPLADRWANGLRHWRKNRPSRAAAPRHGDCAMALAARLVSHFAVTSRDRPWSYCIPQPPRAASGRTLFRWCPSITMFTRRPSSGIAAGLPSSVVWRGLATWWTRWNTVWTSMVWRDRISRGTLWADGWPSSWHGVAAPRASALSPRRASGGTAILTNKSSERYAGSAR